MFAVFVKDIFQDWWLNRVTDKNWVALTIAGRGWNSYDVKILWFDFPPRQGEVARFNDDLSLTILEKQEIEVDGEIQEVWADKEMRVGRLYFEKGAMNNEF